MGSVIDVELARDAYYTGEVLEGTVVLTLEKAADPRGLTLEFLGRESTAITRGSGKHRRTYRSQQDHVNWGLTLLGPGPVAAGVYRFPFRFQIPENALPSYQGMHAAVAYKLSVRLDIPWWPDTQWSREIFIYYARPSVRQFAKPFRFVSTGPRHEFFVELDGDRFFARELIGCRITVTRLQELNIRRIYVHLTAGEWAQAQGQQETTQSKSDPISIPAEAMRLGVPFAFEIPIPAGIQSSYRGMYSYCTYQIQVGLDVPWATDIVASSPIVVVR